MTTCEIWLMCGLQGLRPLDPLSLLARLKPCPPLETCEIALRMTSETLEVAAEFAEIGEDDQLARAGHDRFVFHVPGVRMRDVHGVEADSHGGVVGAARAVGAHPAPGFVGFVCCVD